MENPSNTTAPARPVPEFHQCFKCNYEAVTDQTICPKCGKKVFFTSRNIRTRGIVAMLMGLILVGLIGGIAIFVGSKLATSGSPERIQRESFTLFAIFGLFAFVILLGLNFIVTGGWMLAFGRRNRYLIWIMWAMLILVFVLGGIIITFL